LVTALLLRDTRAALDDVTRLADSRTCAAMLARAGDLFPLRAERIGGPDGIDAWLAEADLLLGRRTLHEQALERLRHQAHAGSVPWQVEQLTSLLATLEQLQAQRARTAADREFARMVHERTVVAPAAAWAKVRAAVAADPRFPGLELAPQPGLVPLGADPRSGLQEFAHLHSGSVPTRNPSSGVLVRDVDSGIVLVLVPGGTPVLGAEAVVRDGANFDPGAISGEGPCHPVTLVPFLLGKYEVTQAQWRRLTTQNPSNYVNGSELQAIDERHPVEQVTWEAAALAMRQWDLCLPTESQWEHAYRAGASTPFPFGTDVHGVQGLENLADADAKAVNSYALWKFADWLRDGHTVHAPVGTFAPNAWGLHDLGGNVREWCDDTWEAYEEVPPRPGDGYRSGRFEKYRVLRGGAFLSDVTFARAAYRYGMPSNVMAPDTGIRAARRLAP
jgi:formylglycine-generating enzyme required for sulfatase activity